MCPYSCISTSTRVAELSYMWAASNLWACNCGSVSRRDNCSGISPLLDHLIKSCSLLNCMQRFVVIRTFWGGTKKRKKENEDKMRKKGNQKEEERINWCFFLMSIVSGRYLGNQWKKENFVKFHGPCSRSNLPRKSLMMTVAVYLKTTD